MKIIGIDLGTTNSAVAVMEGGNPVIIPNSLGDRLTPSVVSFSDSGEILVGKMAKNQAIVNAKRTIASVKRFMGTDKKFDIDGKNYTPEQISSMILHKLKKDAEQYIGETVSKAVITVPAYFNDNQRQATMNAAKIIGLEPIRIINEPTAASLAYGIHNSNTEEKVLVFDLGGGTYDVSILEIGGGVFEVLATNGDNHLGGDDFDNALVEYLVNDFKNDTGIDLRNDKMALQRLREEAVKAKIALSEMTVTELKLPFIAANEKGPLHFEKTLTRSEFESLIEDIVERIKQPALQALEDAELKPSDIGRILLIGGSTRVPLVQETIKSMFDIKIERGINPDEAVALGAAVQGSILAGEQKGIILVDVTPLTLGVETENKKMTPIIKRNTSIPTTKSKIFTTISDYQSTVEIKIFQGEYETTDRNVFLGSFNLVGIRKALMGEPRIEVTFDLDANGVLHVSAIDLDTQAKQEIEIENSANLTSEEIEKMILEAQEYEKFEKISHDKNDLINQIEALKRKANKLKENNQNVAQEKIFEEFYDGLKDAEAELDQNNLEQAKEIISAMQLLMKELNVEN